jgi:hypothetical protein
VPRALGTRFDEAAADADGDGDRGASHRDKAQRVSLRARARAHAPSLDGVLQRKSTQRASARARAQSVERRASFLGVEHSDLIGQEPRALAVSPKGALPKGVHRIVEEHEHVPEPGVIEHMLTKLVILPEDMFRMYWDTVLLVLTLWYAFSVPFEMVFLSDDYHAPFGMKALEWFFTFCFAMDIFLTFGTAFTATEGCA